MIFYKVHEKEEVIIERFGKYIETVQSSGLKAQAPFSFRKIAARVPMGVFQLDVNLTTKTSDDIFVSVPTKLQLQVIDSKKWHYNSQEPQTQVEARVTAVMKQLTSNMEFAHLYQARETLGSNVRDKVAKELSDLYGVQIVDVIVDEPQAPKEVQEAYNSVKASEREATAKVNMAQAAKQSDILQAEGRKEVLRLDGEGVAQQRAAILENYTEQRGKLLAAGVSEEEALQIIMAAMKNDTLRDAASKGNVIITTLPDGRSNDMLAQFQAVAKAGSKANEAQPHADTGAKQQRPQP